MATRAPAEPAASAAPARRLEVASQLSGVPAHEHDHVGHHGHGGESHDGLEHLLLALWQLVVQDLEGDAHGQAQHEGRSDAHPHAGQGVAPVLLAQERGHDADDQRRLHAFAQPDDEGRQHQLARRSDVIATCLPEDRGT